VASAKGRESKTKGVLCSSGKRLDIAFTYRKSIAKVKGKNAFYEGFFSTAFF
jgi:hypothetical protein